MALWSIRIVAGDYAEEPPKFVPQLQEGGPDGLLAQAGDSVSWNNYDHRQCSSPGRPTTSSIRFRRTRWVREDNQIPITSRMKSRRAIPHGRAGSPSVTPGP